MRNEEADNIIIQQMVMVTKEMADVILVIAGDTDVFVLIL